MNSRIFYIDLNPENLDEVLFESQHTSLNIGRLGTFDDSGVVPSCVIEKDNKLLLFTVGFQRCEIAIYVICRYCIIRRLWGYFFLRPHDSILNRTPNRPISQGAPSVIYNNGTYKMWHWYSTKWINIKKLYLDYRIGYAESHDAINWEMKDICCIKPEKDKNEFAVARPLCYI